MHTHSSDFTNATPVFNTKAMMIEAHVATKRLRNSGTAFMDMPYSKIFADRLSYEWYIAKKRITDANLSMAQRRCAKIRADIAQLENKSFHLDISARRSELEAELANLTNPTDPTPTEPAPALPVPHEQKREIINAAGGRFVVVDFIKKDGTERTMKVQPAKLKFHCKGKDASESTQRAVATRKANHPHLMPVWDVESAGPRSVNLNTITRIQADGQTHEYQLAA